MLEKWGQIYLWKQRAEGVGGRGQGKLIRDKDKGFRYRKPLKPCYKLQVTS